MATLQNSIVGCQRIGRGNFTHVSNTSFGCCSFISTTGAYHNTAIGVNTLRNLTSGDCNTAAGYKALCAVTTGGGNSGAGYLAGCSITTGTCNTFLGAFSGVGINGGRVRNTAIGWNSMRSIDGNNNTAIGYCSMTRASGTTVSSNNVAIGYCSATYATSNNNVLVGCTTRAYSGNSTIVGVGRYTGGSDSVQMGWGNGYSAGTYGIALGHNSSAGNRGIAIGKDTFATNCHIAWGNSGNNTRNCIWARWSTLSDQRDKANIQSLNEKYGIEFIKRLKPKSFCWDNRETYVRECGFEFGVKDGTLSNNEENYGFIAQEVQETINELGIKFDALGKEENDAYRLQYDQFIAPIIKTVQEISERLDILDTEVTQLETV